VSPKGTTIQEEKVSIYFPLKMSQKAEENLESQD
jgi:hypothetical protein